MPIAPAPRALAEPVAPPISRQVIGVNSGLHLLLLGGVAAAWGLGDLGSAFTGGLLLTAYVLGLRHAFDPDHIAAIDNTTRALQSGHRTPQSVGMYFALGHSTVVFAAAVLVVVSARWVGLSGDSPVRTALGVWGAAFSGITLVVLAAINLRTLRTLIRASRRAEESDPAGAAGALSRILRPALRRVDRPWHMYPVGFLFGLGFDTATEVSLLILAAGGATAGVPWWVVLLLPLAFTSGMCLLDSADGMFMALAYRWALERPERKLRYNIVMTAVSVCFAAVIGVLGLMSLLGELGVTAFTWTDALSLEWSGVVVLGLFAALFAGAVLRWRRGVRRV